MTSRNVLAKLMTPMIAEEPLGEAFPNSVPLPKSLYPTIQGYLNGEIDDSTSTHGQRESFTFFGQSIKTLQVPYLAELAAKAMVWCKADEVEALVKKNPSILRYRIPKIIDPCGRVLEGKTLLQIAGAMGEFNFWSESKQDKPYGAVDRLAPYLPQSEVMEQLSEQFPADWEVKTEERMRPYWDALTLFANDLVNMPIPPLHFTFEAECKSIIETYRASLIAAANKKVTIGLIFSPQIFIAMGDGFVRNLNHFDGWYSAKSALFWKIGYGFLQQMASGDAPIINTGVRRVIRYKQVPDRSLQLDNGDLYYTQNSNADGNVSLVVWNFLVDDYGSIAQRGSYGTQCWKFFGEAYIEKKYQRCNEYKVIHCDRFEDFSGVAKSFTKFGK